MPDLGVVNGTPVQIDGMPDLGVVNGTPVQMASSYNF